MTENACSLFHRSTSRRKISLEVLRCCEQARVRARLGEAESLLRVLGPQATLERGYSITTNEDGWLLEVNDGQHIVARLRDRCLPYFVMIWLVAKL